MTNTIDPSQVSLGHYPQGERWTFDDTVTAVFDDMLKRSIPAYDEMRKLVFELGRRFVKDNTAIVDLGCSRGEALAPFVRANGIYNSYIGVEISQSMAEAARTRYTGMIGCGVVDIRHEDLRKFYPPAMASLTLAVLTFQFMPINYRQRTLKKVYDHTVPGGAFILVEKLLGDGPTIDEHLVERYHQMKVDHGYTQDEVDAKAASLEYACVPLTARYNEQLVREAGFRQVDCFWRHLNFGAWLCIK